MKKAIMSIFTVWVFVSSMFIGLISFSDIENIKAPYIPHAPIRINNNAEFVTMAGLEGWTGDGSPGNPYIIEGYDINGSGYGYCIYIGNTTVYFEVRDCYLHEAEGVKYFFYHDETGMILYNVQNGIITNNTVSSNTDLGIQLSLSSNNTIVNNNATLNFWHGFYLDKSNNNTYVNNTALNNRDGIVLVDSNNNIIANNTISSNSNEGILLTVSKSNTITNNTIMNNKHSIYIVDIDNQDNRIYHNNFINNKNQAYDVTNNANQWDNGYPSGGNFWSDYIGNDSFKGPNQDIPGNDGIGDTNYSIDSDSVDNYPLMSPVGNLTYLYEGWNLISIPYIHSEPNLDSVLSSINDSYDVVQWYNTSDYSDQWKHHHISKPSHLNDLNSIAHTIGFWIHITEPGGVLFEYTGTQPTSNQSIPLHPGWNMVGYPSLSNRNRTAALNNLTFGVEVDAIWTFNAATQTWEEIGMGDYYEVGRGYWIHATQECVWEVGV